MKTEPFTKLRGSLSSNHDCLFNTALLLVGDFGLGKTTLLDYLAYHVVQYDIVPIRITCGRSYATAAGFLDSFYSKLKTAFESQVTAITGQSRSPSNLDIEDEIKFLAEIICGRKRGVLILLDDYHKHLTATTQVFEFLGQLQILKDSLTREDIKLGFVVSGLPEWEVHLPTNTQLSGFLDSPVMRMPQLTSKAIADVFNQRIRAFCVDSHVRTIREDFVERLFKQTQTTSGYREYLNRIITELERDNLAIIDTPIDISEDELTAIRARFDRDTEIAASLKKLQFESRFKRFTQDQINKCFELLVQVGLRQGVSENDDLFIKNAFYFQRLKESGLIQKQKASGKKGAFLWGLKKKLTQIAQGIEQDFKRSLSDFLLKLYGTNIARGGSELPGPATGLAKQLEEIIKRLGQSPAFDSLQQAKGLIDSLNLENPTNKQRLEMIDRAKLAVESLSKAMFQLDDSQRLLSTAGIDRIHDRLEIHWLDEEAITEALRRLDQCSSTSERSELEMALKQTRDGLSSLVDAIHETAKDITDNERPFAFRNRAISHNREAIKIFSEVQLDYYSAEAEKHFQYVQRVTDYVESALRGFLYVTANLAFGSDDYFAGVPQQEKKYAIQNKKARRQFSSVANAFEGLTRSQFRTVIAMSGPIKEVIADAVDFGWGFGDREAFFDLFAEESIATSHKQHSVYSPADRNRYLRYTKLAEQLLAKINEFVRGVVVNNAIVLAVEIDSIKEGITNCIFQIGMKVARKRNIPESHFVHLSDERPFNNSDKLQEHCASADDLAKVRSTIESSFFSKPYMVLDLFDLDFLRNHFDLPFIECICCLEYLAWVTKEINLSEGFGSTVIITRSKAARNRKY